MQDCICSKSDKIDNMERDLKTLKRVVLEGNGGDPLNVVAKETRDNQQKVADTLWKLNSNVEILMKFQNKMEAERDFKAEAQNAKMTKRSWLVPMVVAGIVSLITTVVIILVT